MEEEERDREEKCERELEGYPCKERGEVRENCRKGYIAEMAKEYMACSLFRTSAYIFVWRNRQFSEMS